MESGKKEAKGEPTIITQTPTTQEEADDVISGWMISKHSFFLLPEVHLFLGTLSPRKTRGDVMFVVVIVVILHYIIHIALLTFSTCACMYCNVT